MAAWCDIGLPAVEKGHAFVELETHVQRAVGRVQVWVSPVRPRVIEALLSFGRLEAVRLEAYSSLETARCFCALRHLPLLTHLDLRLSGSSFALDDNLEALASLAACSRLVRAHPSHLMLENCNLG